MTVDVAALARELGVKASEVVEADDSPAGPVVTTRDGVRMIRADVPDAEGKTGWMFLELPHARYQGTFPVYVPVPAPAETAAEPGEAYPARAGAARVLEWVAGDHGRAIAALAQENDRKKPRRQLVGELEAIIAQWADQAGGDDGS